MPALSFSRGMVLAPVGAVPTAVHGDLREEQFCGQTAFCQVGSDSLLHSFCGDLRIEEHEDGGSGTAEGSAKNAGLARQFLERGEQGTEWRAVRLMNAIFERGGE